MNSLKSIVPFLFSSNLECLTQVKVQEEERSVLLYYKDRGLSWVIETIR